MLYEGPDTLDMSPGPLKSIAIPQRQNRLSKKQRSAAKQLRSAIENAEEYGPTDFTLMRRAEILGESLVQDIVSRQVRITGRHSQAATTSSLAVLFHKDRITQPQYRAGILYASMRRVLFGRAVPKPSVLAKILGENIFATMGTALAQVRSESMTDEERDEAIEEMRLQYYRGDNRLRRLHYARRVREILRRVVIDDMLPDPRRPNHLARLREGLTELSDTWGLEDKKR